MKAAKIVSVSKAKKNERRNEEVMANDNGIEMVCQYMKSINVILSGNQYNEEAINDQSVMKMKEEIF